MIINSAVIVIILGFIFTRLMPAVGFSATVGPTIFVGSFVGTFAYIGFIRSLEETFDLKFQRFIDYKITFPITTSWLIISYVASYAMQLFFTSIPLLILGPLLLGSSIDFSTVHLPSFLAMYATTIIFYALFFVSITFLTSFMWFRFNIWARLLTPLNFFGCIWYTWHGLYSVSKPLGILVLANPYTYISEGLRTSLLHSETSLPLSICIPIILLFSGIGLFVTVRIVYKAIDAVP
ncbi:MAG: hypothetical protein WD068_01245 [Candidatus Babeliales bacterium]